MVEELCEKYEVNKNVVLSLLYYNNGVGMDSYDYSLLNNPGHVLPCMIDYRNIDEAELYKINDSNYVIKFSNIESGLENFIKLLKEDYGCNNNSYEEFIYSYIKNSPVYEFGNREISALTTSYVYKNIIRH